MDKLGIRELLRYGYGGFLCAFIAALLWGAQMEELVKVLGNAISPLVTLAVGAAIYLIFKTLVGDLFLWRLVHWWHVRREGTGCRIYFLEKEYEVPRGQGLAAWAVVRGLLDKETRAGFHVQHSETYLLFLTAAICGLGSFLGAFLHGVFSAIALGLGASALISFFAGVTHDIALCRNECDVMVGTLTQEQIAEALASWRIDNSEHEAKKGQYS